MATTYAALILDWQRLSTAQRNALCASNPEDLATIQQVLADGLFVRYELEAADLEDVFYRLNMEHPADYRGRSLSVGDLVIDVDANRAHLCAPCGWRPIPLPARLPATP